jgi:glutathione reductase (NADPH)
MTSHPDLIVLGAGSGGLATALRAAEHGARVALVDPAALGGTCVHRGCVPKKALWFAAQWEQAQRLAAEVGFATQPGPLDWARFRAVRARYIAGIEQRYGQRVQRANVQRFPHRARFVGPHVVELADDTRLQAPHIVIATGGRPRTLSLQGFDLGMVSDDVFALSTCPRRVAIVGGGYIAVEFAGLLQALGSEVTMLARERLLQGFDDELVQALATHMHAQGIRVRYNTDVTAARRADAGILLDDAPTGVDGPYDALLWAVGRTPNTDDLGLAAVGVHTDDHGRVRVDAQQKTSVEGILAIGDASTDRALTPVAVAAGRHLADRLFGGQPDAHLDGRNIPSVVFSKPPLGMVGMTEAQARGQHGDQVVIYRRRFTPMQWALAGEQGQSLMKLVCVGAEERVVGIHALGPGVDEMLQGFAVALKLGLRKRDLDATLAIHPTSSEELVLMR